MTSTIRLSIFFLLLSGLFGWGCSAASPPAASDEKPPTATVEKKKTLGQLLLERSDELKAENEELKEKVAELQAQQSQYVIDSSGRVDAIEKTIVLLERNITALKQELAALSSDKPSSSSERNQAKVPVPSPPSPTAADRKKSEIKSAGIIPEIKTPEKSKAIEAISLLPAAAGETTRNTPVARERTADSTKQSSHLPATRKKREPWKDPDLIPPSSPIQLSVTPGAKRYYQSAFKNFTKQDYSKAAQEFERFIRRFPNDQDADNSQFWIGQCHYKMENFLEAEHAFRKVLKNYIHGETVKGYKTPDAILMLGKIYLRRDKPNRSRNYFKHIMAHFPNSQSAVKARKEIQAMDSF